MDNFSDRIHDPLLFLSNDKSDLDNFLLTGGDMDHINEELQAHITDNSLDFDSLEGNGHLGDMNWLHNSSLSTLAHLDGEDTSDGTTMLSVNPQSIIPMQVIDQRPNFLLHSSENANSAAMRLHANCSNMMGGNSPEEKPVKTQANVMNLNQEHQSIRILSVAGTVSGINSPSKANFIIASTRDSPLKSQTFVLNTANGIITPSHNITTVSQSQVTNTANIVLASPQKLRTLSTDKNGRVLLKPGSHLLSPSQASPVLLGRLQTGVQPQIYQAAQVISTNGVSSTASQISDMATVSSTTSYGEEKAYPKPVFSYSCLIALALKNSKNGSLPVSEIYNFMCENFPYFKTAPDGWKNSVRHNLSLNKCFAKVDNPKLNQGAKKGCLWALNPAKVTKMEEEISKWGKKDPVGLLTSMAYPENLEAIEKGQAGLHYAKKLAEERKKCTPLKAEATPVKTEYSVATTLPYCHSPVSQSHCKLPVEMMIQQMTPVKARFVHSPQVQQTYSPSHQQRSYTSSPMSSSNAYNHTPVKPSSTADFNVRTSSINDIHSTINTDALADIVLQNGMWESEDLENEIDIDLICDSPSSQILFPMQSPLQHTHSPHTVPSTVMSGYCSPSIQAPFSTVVQSPLPQSSPNPNSVRNNLFGVSTPTRRTLYT